MKKIAVLLSFASIGYCLAASSSGDPLASYRSMSRETALKLVQAQCQLPNFEEKIQDLSAGFSELTVSFADLKKHRISPRSGIFQKITWKREVHFSDIFMSAQEAYGSFISDLCYILTESLVKKITLYVDDFENESSETKQLLYKALASSNLTSLSLYGQRSAALKELAIASLSCPHMTHLTVRNSLNEDDLIEFSASLKQNTQIQFFSYSSRYASSTQTTLPSFQTLCESLKDHPSIRSLTLGRLVFKEDDKEPAIACLVDLLQHSQISELRIDYFFDSEEAPTLKPLIEHLRTTRTLRHVSLGTITTLAGSLYLARALAENKTFSCKIYTFYYPELYDIIRKRQREMSGLPPQ